MPHCDTLNGPVVLAAKKAIATGNIHYVLIWVAEDAEEELLRAFRRTLAAGELGKEAKEVADHWFYETAVRLHRAGEGEGFAGLKPDAQTDPIVRAAEDAIEKKDADELIEEMGEAVKQEMEVRFAHVLETRDYSVDDVAAGRKFITAYIGFVVFAHHFHEGLFSGSHLDEKSKHEH